MIRWTADAALAELIRRYYAGEAGLWVQIRASIDQALRARGVSVGAYHIRLRRSQSAMASVGSMDNVVGYDILIEEAAAYANDP
jgi:hypothetical protein